MPNNCRLCNNKLFSKPLLQLKGMPKAAQYFPEKKHFKSDKGISLKVYQCSGCGLVQLNAKPVDYFKQVITAASLSGKSRTSRLDQMKEFVDKFGLRKKKILEIGAGKGDMLDVLKEVGMDATGIEGSKESVKTGRSFGRKMIDGYIGQMKKIKGSPFNAFVCFNYLEHLPNPDKVIKNIYNNTMSNAVGFVTVPNLEYLLKTKCFYEFVADHLSYFTKKTLTYAFERNGFEVLDCQLINNYNDVAIKVRKREVLDIAKNFVEVKKLIKDLQQIIFDYKIKNKKVAVWGAGHRTLALLALAKLKDIEYVIDSAKFKQGRFTPVNHLKIVPPENLKKQEVDLVIVMVPGIYPEEVLKKLKEINVKAKVALLQGNKIKFI